MPTFIRKGNRAIHRTFNGKRQTGITSSALNPLDRLPVYKRNYVKARVAGKNTREAALAAGVSGRQGHKYDNEADVQEAYRHLVRQAIPEQELVELLRGGCYAMIPHYNIRGEEVGNTPDWKTRRPYIEMAAEHGGLVTRGAKDQVAGIVIAVQHLGAAALPVQHPAAAAAAAAPTLEAE
jgi:hypothetical protein